MGVFLDLTGKKFGRLSALQRAENRGGHTVWRVACDCGKILDVRAQHLRNGNTKSCGCLDRDVLIARSTKHGAHGSSAYISWAGMMSRCTNPNHTDYHLYGGRGITVDPRWHDFSVFLKDMGQRPPKTSLDRIDTDGMYTKSNCRWATSCEQSRNKRNNRWIKFGNEQKVLSDWAQHFGISPSALHRMLSIKGDIPGLLYYIVKFDK